MTKQRFIRGMEIDPLTWASLQTLGVVNDRSASAEVRIALRRHLEINKQTIDEYEPAPRT